MITVVTLLHTIYYIKCLRNLLSQIQHDYVHVGRHVATYSYGLIEKSILLDTLYAYQRLHFGIAARYFFTVSSDYRQVGATANKNETETETKTEGCKQ